ncbi:MAG: hypothetical protein H0T18_03965 [Chloroflexia bacterium]|nr:hypothetical protein [Chloroflexia bacterium]
MAAADSYSTGTDWDIAPADSVAAAPDTTYLGAYGNDFYGDVEIARSTDGIGAIVGDDPRRNYDRGGNRA